MVNENLRNLLNQMESKRTVEDNEIRGGARAPLEHVKPVVGGSRKNKKGKALEKEINKMFEELEEMEGGGKLNDLNGSGVARYLISKFKKIVGKGNNTKDSNLDGGNNLPPNLKELMLRKFRYVGFGKVKSSKDSNLVGGGGGMFNSTMVNSEQVGKGKSYKLSQAPKNVKFPDVSIPRGRGRPATKPAKTKRKLSEKQIKRNNLVKEIMKEYGVSLPQASKYIKENNLI